MNTDPKITSSGGLDIGRAVTAGLVATIVMTIAMALFGQNIMKMLGGMILPDAATTVQYIVGGTVHLLIGLTYGVIYAWLLGGISQLSPLIKGGLYGAALTAIALAFMPLAAGVGGAANPCNPCGGAYNPCGAKVANPCNPCGDKASNPCNPCGAKVANPCNPCGSKAANPCNPCGAKVANPCNPCGDNAPNPCNPCGEKAANPCNPCNPCGEKAANPCNPCNPCGEKAANPCNPCNPCGGKVANPCNPCGAKVANPCNPCGGGGSPYGALISLINHLIFGFTLAFVYARGRGFLTVDP